MPPAFRRAIPARATMAALAMLSFAALRKQVKREVTKIDAGYRVSYFETYSGGNRAFTAKAATGAKEKQNLALSRQHSAFSPETESRGHLESGFGTSHCNHNQGNGTLE
jgi:hypothetical protein